MMNDVHKLVVSLTRLADVTADFVSLKLQEMGRETPPVQMPLPFEAAEPKKPVRKKPKASESESAIKTENIPVSVEDVKPAEKVNPAESVKPAKVLDEKSLIAEKLAKTEFFVKTLRAKGLDGIVMAKQAIARAGAAKLNDIKVENIPGYLADLDQMLKATLAAKEQK